MFKILYIFTIMLLSLKLFASEPVLATLRSVNSNEIQKFSIAQSSFYCRPYGVVTIDRLYSHPLENSFNSSCRDGIERYYKNNPQMKYFASSLMQVQQLYHIEFKNRQCIVYSNGAKSYSEALIEKGLAVKERLFKDEEFQDSLAKAQVRAKYKREGMWSDNILYDCIVEFYK